MEAIQEVNTEKITIKDIRNRLKQYSKQAAELKNQGKVETVNEGIIKLFYTDVDNREFKTFLGWKKEGKKIKKGAKAFPVWGNPRQVAVSTTDEDEKYKFFPVSYLFSNNQVI